jgi:hypothetical protein
MKRRTFGLLSGTSMVALMGGGRAASAQASSEFATLSQTTLTPMGSERAGNAAGTIPAWTGGMTAVPAGIQWDPATEMTPDFWADESSLYTVDASNMAQYTGSLSAGVQTLIQKQGLSLKVYPTHRTAAYPQWVYDNILSNSTTAKLNPEGGRLGFTGGYGGFPFPIPDVNTPLDAGAQIMWNHITNWQGSSFRQTTGTFTLVDGQMTLTSGALLEYYFPYYQQSGNLSNYNGRIYYLTVKSYAPSNLAGGLVIVHYSTNPLQEPNVAWQLELGQGRLRMAPQLTYDTPSYFTNGISSDDELYGFNGALDEYDWKYIGKQEALVPYNNNKMRITPSKIAHGQKFLNPDVVRWELHRVWVVDATLHPGSRNVLAHRRFYVDEDTWTVVLADAWDAQGNIYKLDMTFNCVFPNLPGTVLLNSASYNLQTGDYTTVSGPWGDAPYNHPWTHGGVNESDFDPQTAAASAAY